MTDDKNNGDDFRHVAYGIYEENGEIKSGVIPDYIVKAEKERNSQAIRDYYAKATERTNQYTEQLKAQRAYKYADAIMKERIHEPAR